MNQLIIWSQTILLSTINHHKEAIVIAIIIVVLVCKLCRDITKDHKGNN